MSRGSPFGHEVSSETRAKIGATLMGHSVSDETRQKMSARRSRKMPSSHIEKSRLRMLGNHYTRGRALSDEHRAKLRVAWDKRTEEERRMFGARACAGNKSPSSLEIIVRQLLDALSIPYEPSKPIGFYVVDIYVPDRNLVIECDGEYWHNLPGAKKRDLQRDLWLQRHGYRVVRLLEREIKAGQALKLLAGTLIEDAEAI